MPDLCPVNVIRVTVIGKMNDVRGYGSRHLLERGRVELEAADVDGACKEASSSSASSSFVRDDSNGSAEVPDATASGGSCVTGL